MAQIPIINLAGYNFLAKDHKAKKQVGQLLVDAFSEHGVVGLEGTDLGIKH